MLRNNLSSNTYYADTVTLANSCYTFELYDTGGDGFWYWNQYDGNPMEMDILTLCIAHRMYSKVFIRIWLRHLSRLQSN